MAAASLMGKDDQPGSISLTFCNATRTPVDARHQLDHRMKGLTMDRIVPSAYTRSDTPEHSGPNDADPVGADLNSAVPSSISPWLDLNGPYGAYIMGLAIDENNPERVFCTTTGGGAFRSIDGAETWSPSQDGMYYDYARQITVDPNNSNVLFCAAYAYWRPTGADIYKSTDAGETWSSCNIPATQWLGVHVCRNNSDVVLAGGDIGIWRSQDGGSSWSWVYGSGQMFLYFCEDPSSPDTIYAGSYGSGLFRSTDMGITWIRIDNIGSGNIRIVDVHGQDSNIIYADGNPTGVFRSTDYRESWTNVKEFGVWGVACAPSNGDIVCAVGDGPDAPFGDTPGVFLSSDAGDTWYECTLPTDQFYAPYAMRVAFDPTDPEIIYVGCYRAGVFKTTDGGMTWFDANMGLKNVFVNEVVAHPDDPKTIWAGTWQAGIYKTVNAGKSWMPSGYGWSGTESNRAVDALAIDPSNPDHLLLGGYNSGIWESFNGGESWSPTNLQSGAEIEKITFAPSDPTQVWAGCTNFSTSKGMWKSTNGGTTWILKKANVACYSVSVHPTNSDRAVATTVSSFFYYPAQIWLTTDGGDSWADVYTEEYGFIVNSGFSPVNPNIVWAASLYENILISGNSGVTWHDNWGDFDPPGRPFTIMADPVEEGVAYLPLDDDGGFYCTLNYGLNWHRYSPGLWCGALVPMHLNLFPPHAPRIIYTGTMGNGVFGMLQFN